MRVLVVDDERDIRDGCERVLTRAGYEVCKASSGQEGLDLIDQEPLHILLLDLKMPGIGGMEVLTRLRESHPDLLVIIITGYATIETAIEAMKVGAYDFIPKPFTPDQLRIVVGRAAEKRRLRLEAERLENERRRTLRDLDAEKSRIHTILNCLADGVVVTTPQGDVALLNPAASRMLCLSETPRPGEPLSIYIEDKGLLSQVADISSGKGAEEKMSRSCELKVGDGACLMAHSTPVLGEDGTFLGAVTVLVDVTELKLLDRLKSEFVTKVSHELRSPLSSIDQQLAMVLCDLVGDVPQEQRQVLSRAKEKTQGLISFIGDLLDLSRIESGLSTQEEREVDISEVLRKVVEMLRPNANNRAQTVTVALPEKRPLPQLHGDATSLESIFVNLVTNALHYSDEGSEVRIEAGRGPDEIRVAVKDNGFGIEARHLEKIFDKFYRVKNEKTRYIVGTGLGLPIVKGIVDAMGGRIEVQSEVGSGSTFTVYLPVHR